VRRWLREVETLSDTEEKVVYIYEPEIGKNLSVKEDKRLVRDLIDFQEGRSGIPNCQVGKGDEERLDGAQR
jgi:hypothetical protein